jgi:TRAP-type transport system periplasmic protein
LIADPQDTDRRHSPHKPAADERRHGRALPGAPATKARAGNPTHLNTHCTTEGLIMMSPHTPASARFAACAFALMASLAAAHAADIKERTLKLPVVTAIDHPLGVGAVKWSELVEKKSGGKIKMKVYAGGTLGAEVPVISSMQGGTIEASVVLPANLAGLAREFIMLDLPFVFETEQQAAQVLDGPVGQRLLDQLPAKGLVGLGFMESGFRNYTNSKRPITKVEDFAGLKLRALQSPLFVDFTSALGAVPAPLSFTELYTALENKAVDGQENTYATVENAKFDEVQKYSSETRHVYASQIVLLSGKFWNQLSEDERALFRDAAKEAITFQRQAARDADRRAHENLAKKGMQMTAISAQERARLQDKVKPVVDKYAGELPEAVRKQFFAELEKARLVPK